MKRSLLGTAGAPAALGAGALAAYAFVVRPWHLRWGASDDELNCPLPGDEVKPEADDQVTHAITINAPAAEVWKWLVQIGQGRGGFYSYDLLENAIGLDIHTSEELRPEFQDLKVGDFVRGAPNGWFGGRFDGKAGWFVVDMARERHLVLRDEIDHGSWAFILRPVDRMTTRMIIRGRGNKPAKWPMKLFGYTVFEPAHFIMERKMLLRIKELAERSVNAQQPGVATPPVEDRILAS